MIVFGNDGHKGIFFEEGEIDKAYLGDTLVWGAEKQGRPISELNVGESVFLKESGSPAEWVIVHKGNPGKGYQADGIWLLRKDIFSMVTPNADDAKGWRNHQFDEACNDFFDTKLSAYASAVLDAKIPSNYNPGAMPFYGPTDTRKCFLLSATEVGIRTEDMSYYSYFPESRVNVRNTAPDAKLSFFDLIEGTTPKRIAVFNGAPSIWATRTNAREESGIATAGIVSMSAAGGRLVDKAATKKGIRPAVVVKADALIDSSGVLIP